jgi:hypothetical protein
MKEGFHYHRKLWEYCYIAQALQERGKLGPGSRGLGFAVGREPLPALFASLGCHVVGTDLEPDAQTQAEWVATGQHASSIDAMNERGICPASEFQARARFEYADMNHVPEHLRDFDFLWSSCAIEHVGSLKQCMDAVVNMMKCLKPGGVAVHTTEFNVLSNEDTITDGSSVIPRRQDLLLLRERLHAAGHQMEPLDFECGTQFADYFVDEPPYKGFPHLKLRLDKYIATSIGIIVTAGK